MDKKKLKKLIGKKVFIINENSIMFYRVKKIVGDKVLCVARGFSNAILSPSQFEVLK